MCAAPPSWPAQAEWPTAPYWPLSCTSLRCARAQEATPELFIRKVGPGAACRANTPFNWTITAGVQSGALVGAKLVIEDEIAPGTTGVQITKLPSRARIGARLRCDR